MGASPTRPAAPYDADVADVGTWETYTRVVPRVLCENAGLNAEQVMPLLRAAHAAGQTGAGLDIQEGTPVDLAAQSYYDLYDVKYWALKLATDAATTVLKVDQIIMAKQAGGPKPGAGPGGKKGVMVTVSGFLTMHAADPLH